MRSRLSSAYVTNVSKDPLDRIVRLTFRVDDEQGATFRRLVVQLTGRTADLFVLDELNRIQAVLREQGQARLNEKYEPPPRPTKEAHDTLPAGPDHHRLNSTPTFQRSTQESFLIPRQKVCVQS